MNRSAIVKPCLEKVIRQGGNFAIFNETLVQNPELAMFDSQYWLDKNAVTGTAQGRGTTWFLKYQQQDWVLRHYYRGGLVGKLLTDQYIFTGLEQTRAAQEFKILNILQTANLPAPKPIGYRVQKSGLVYRADLITERIQDAQDLVAILSNQQVSAALWQEIGHVIQQFHSHGIYHHDLNAHNILIDQQGKVWLIDFDRAQQRPKDKRWQQGNLARLQRSFLKERNQLPQFNWQESDWQMLLEGYLAQPID